MKPIHVAATIVRLFAICIFVYAINLSVSTVMLIASSDSTLLNVSAAGIIVALTIVSIVLWNFPVSISRKLTGMPAQFDEDKLEFNQGEFLSICIFALGLYFSYGLVGEAIYWYIFLNDPMVIEMQSEIPADQRASLWAFGARAIFVLLLLIGNRIIVKAFNTLRHGG